MEKSGSRRVDSRFRPALMLTCIALILFGLDRFLPAPPRVYGGLSTIPDGVMVTVQTAVDTLFARYGVDGTRVRTWKVQSSRKTPLRIEQRMTVSPLFPTLLFNHDLAALVSGEGVRVVATERTRERTVTMHVLHDDAIFRTMTFVIDADLQLPVIAAKSKGGSH